MPKMSKALLALAGVLLIIPGCAQEKSWMDKTCPEKYSETSETLCNGDDYWYE